MATLAVVERLDVLDHSGLRLEPRRPAAAVDELLLEGGEERLGDGVRLRRQLLLIRLLRGDLFV